MEGDRERWNAKWRERAGDLEPPTRFVEEHLALLPRRGRALDVAGGAGRHAVLLARHGLDVTLVDGSDVALEQAERRATTVGVVGRIRLVRHDLDDPLPFAPLFDVLVMVHYLNREQRDALAELLVVDGLLIAMQPTVKNLERHASPSRRFLVEEGELETWATRLGFDVEVAREGWTVEGRHEAELVARKRPRARVLPPREPPMGPSGPYR